MKHLILITVGPVQEFIAAARSFGDLRYGSTLLSELSKAVAKNLAENDCQLIFPAPEHPESDLVRDSALKVPNKVMAIGGDQPAFLVESAKAVYLKTLREYAAAAKDKIAKKIKFDENLFDAQIDDFGEFYGVWVPLSDNYKTSRDQLEVLLAARKAVRTFDAPSWDGTGIRKSSLDGARESVFAEEPRGAGRSDILRRGEYLDAIGAVKRFGASYADFKDILEIAMAPWFIGASSVFGSGFYNSDDKEAILNAIEKGQPDDAVREAKNKPGVATVPMPHAYTCYLVGDGDKMGAAIDALEEIGQHQRFTRELSRFAARAEAIVTEHDGCLVYSGGDDVMAVLPLHTMLTCADTLRNEFKAIMNKACGQLAIKPTFSVGVAIVHHAEDLGQVRKLARDAEITAKNEGGRNSLCIIQSKRSGAPLKVFGSWDVLLPRVQKLLSLYLDAGLSTRAGYQLRQAATECGERLEWVAGDKPGNASAAEVLRIMGRKQTDSGNLDADRVLEVVSSYTTIKELADDLVVVRQVAQSQAMAGGRGFEKRNGK